MLKKFVLGLLALSLVLALAGCPQEETPPYIPEVPFASWQALFDSPVIGKRGNPTMTVVADGIEVTGRGTTQYDHNNGIAIDIAALRRTGTDVTIEVDLERLSATITKFVFQGLNLEETVDGGGLATLSVGPAVAIDIDTSWMASDKPFIAGFETGENGDYKVLDIRVDGTSIID